MSITTPDEQLVNYFSVERLDFLLMDTVISPCRGFFLFSYSYHIRFFERESTITIQDVPVQRPLFTPTTSRFWEGKEVLQSRMCIERVLILLLHHTD